MSLISNLGWKELVKFLESNGCRLDRIKGDHFVYVKNGVARPMVVPKWKNLPEFIVRNNLRVLGKSVRDLKIFFGNKRR